MPTDVQAQTLTRTPASGRSQRQPSAGLVPSHGRRAGAYTFVEMMLVLTIATVLMSVAIPRYVDSLVRFRVDAAAKRIAADIGFAQRQALVQSRNQTVQFIPNGANGGTPNTYVMPNVNYVNFAASGVVVDLAQDPYKVMLSSAAFGAGTTLMFDRYGNPSSGGSVVVTSGSATKTVNVNANTGRASIP